MKKFIALLLILVTCLPLTACGGNTDLDKYKKYESLIDCLEANDYNQAQKELDKLKAEHNAATNKYIGYDEFLSYVEMVEIDTKNAMDYIVIEEVVELDAFGDEETAYMSTKLKEGYKSINAAIKFEYSGVAEYESGSPSRSGEVIIEFHNYTNYYNIVRIKSFKNEIFTMTLDELKITNATGKIFKLNIPQAIWETDAAGKKFIRIGTAEESTTIYENDLWTVVDAIEKALDKQ